MSVEVGDKVIGRTASVKGKYGVVRAIHVNAGEKTRYDIAWNDGSEKLDVTLAVFQKCDEFGNAAPTPKKSKPDALVPGSPSRSVLMNPRAV